MSTELLPDQPQYTDFSTILADERFKNLSGLDMAPTIEWYTANKKFLLEVYNRSLQFANKDAYLPPTEGLEHLELDRAKLRTLRGLVPSPARERSIINTIIGQPPLWFHKDSLEGEQKPTTDPNECITPNTQTGFIPGYTSYENWPFATLYLYTIPPAAVKDSEVASLITAEADIHEEIHGVTTNLMYGEKTLVLPFGATISGLDFIVGVFGDLAERHTPISHYSSHFRDDEGKFTNPEDPRFAVGEELAETATTLLLGYGSGNLTNLQVDPLADRPELKKVIMDLLHAQVIPENEVVQTMKVSAEELQQHYLAGAR